MAIRDSIVGAIQSGQTAVGSALTGGGAAVMESGSGAVPLLEDLRSISRENEGNTERLTNVLKQMFAFDKTRFQRERDQQREADKESIQGPSDGAGGGGGLTKDEITGGLGAAGLAAIASLAFFAKELGMNTDILKLPQQLKSIRAMSTFAKGIGNLATLGLGGKLADDVKDALKATRLNPKVIGQQLDLFDDAVKTRSTSFFGKGGILSTSYTKTLDSVADSFKTFKTSITSNRAFVTIADGSDHRFLSNMCFISPFNLVG